MPTRQYRRSPTTIKQVGPWLTDHPGGTMQVPLEESPMPAHHTSSKPFTLSPSQLNVLRQSANRSPGTPGQLFNYGLLPRTREILLQHGYIINEYEVRDAAERQKLHDLYHEAISNAR